MLTKISLQNFTFCSSLVGSVDRAYSYSKLSKYYIMEFALCHELKVVLWSYIQSAGRTVDRGYFGPKI